MSLKNLTIRIALIAFVAFTFVGCASKPKVDLSGIRANPNAASRGSKGGAGSDTETYIEGPTGVEDLTGGIGGGDGIGKPGEWDDTNKPVKGTEDGNGFLKNASRWTDCVVYFSYDQSELAASERAKVDALGKFLLENADKGLIIEGHADERGSDEYNRALGERRALSVQNYLAIMGVAENRMQTISYGEDHPAVANPQSEADHQLNRRAEFVLGDL